MVQFKDPQGKFTILVNPDWKYNNIKDTRKPNLNQFEVTSDCVFQISCNPINERISQVIRAKKLIAQDKTMPNFSFVEDYQISEDVEMYNWMALVDDQFFFAMFFFNPETKDRKKLGWELHDIRFALRRLIVHSENDTDKKCPGFIPMDHEDHKDYNDIMSWRDLPAKYYQNIGRQDPQLKTTNVSSVNVDVVKLYALLTTKISHQPNGFHDLLRLGQPLDNPIWWDFILECDKGFIQIWRTPFIIEALYYFDGDLDLEAFFNSNIKRYETEIDAKIDTFDRHTIYINHYQSYSKCVETLWKKIKEIDLTVPESPQSHLSTDTVRENYIKEVEQFMQNSVSYHALAKSLVLNAAFKVESFLNLVIRIGSTAELRSYPDVLLKFLKQEFSLRVKNIGFYTQILTSEIDMGGNVYRETKELMTLRNKYVHYEEDTVHNKLGEVYYDRDYPLHQIEKNRPAIDAVIKTYHQPDMDSVRKAYETSQKFVEMIQSLFIDELKSNLIFLIQQNPIGYNETKGVYSAVYTPNAVDFFTGME